jgi:periplasmic divalent cation tolerance protein
MTDVAYLAVLTTADSRELAERLARTAVAGRLAACAQIDGPITSVYRWQGAVETEQEWRVQYKTTAARYPELEEHIKATHGYATPEIIATPVVGGSAEYLAWLVTETAAEPADGGPTGGGG